MPACDLWLGLGCVGGSCSWLGPWPMLERHSELCLVCVPKMLGCARRCWVASKGVPAFPTPGIGLPQTGHAAPSACLSCSCRTSRRDLPVNEAYHPVYPLNELYNRRRSRHASMLSVRGWRRSVWRRNTPWRLPPRQCQGRRCAGLGVARCWLLVVASQKQHAALAAGIVGCLCEHLLLLPLPRPPTAALSPTSRLPPAYPCPVCRCRPPQAWQTCCAARTCTTRCCSSTVWVRRPRTLQQAARLGRLALPSPAAAMAAAAMEHHHHQQQQRSALRLPLQGLAGASSCPLGRPSRRSSRGARRCLWRSMRLLRLTSSTKGSSAAR